MAMLQVIKERLENSIKYSLVRSNPRRNIFILGDGRSGTTWLCEILNFDGSYLESFEPFHGRRNLHLPDRRIYPVEGDFQGVSGESLKRYMSLVKRGGTAFRKRGNPLPLNGMIIKDISSHFIIDVVEEWEMKKS